MKLAVHAYYIDRSRWLHAFNVGLHRHLCLLLSLRRTIQLRRAALLSIAVEDFNNLVEDLFFYREPLSTGGFAPAGDWSGVGPNAADTPKLLVSNPTFLPFFLMVRPIAYWIAPTALTQYNSLLLPRSLNYIPRFMNKYCSCRDSVCFSLLHQKQMFIQMF